MGRKASLVFFIAILIIALIAVFLLSGCRRAKIARALASATQSSEISDLEDGTAESDDSSQDLETGIQDQNDDESQSLEGGQQDLEQDNQSDILDLDNGEADPGEGPDADIGDLDEVPEQPGEEQQDQPEEEPSEEVQEDLPEVQMTEYTKEITVSRGGSSLIDAPSINGIVTAGDGSSNKEMRGYAAFSIHQLEGATVKDVRLNGVKKDIAGSPFDHYGSLIIKTLSCDIDMLESSLFTSEGVEIASIGKPNFGISNKVLKGELQNAINSGTGYFQLCFCFETNPVGLENNTDDFVSYNPSGINLTVTYELPE